MRWESSFRTAQHRPLRTRTVLNSHSTADGKVIPFSYHALGCYLFHEMTLTSVECAAILTAGPVLPPAVLTSHTHTVPSTPQEAKTLGSEGDHWTGGGEGREGG